MTKFYTGRKQEPTLWSPLALAIPLFLLSTMTLPSLALSAESGSFFEQAFSCAPSLKPNCDNKELIEICNVKRATCEAHLNNSSQTELKSYLIDCNQQTSCFLSSSENLLKGCADLGQENWKKIQDYIGQLQTLIEKADADCQKMGPEKGLDLYRQCLMKALPDIPIPENFDFFFRAIENRYQSLRGWLSGLKQKVHTSIKKNCESPRSHSEETFQRCRFHSFLDELLTNLEQPYANSRLKTLTDLITETYVLKISEHNQIEGCLTPEGRGRAFCQLMLAVSTGSAQVAWEITGVVPSPKTVGSEVASEVGSTVGSAVGREVGRATVVSQTKSSTPGIPRSKRTSTDTDSLRRQNRDRLTPEKKKLYLAQVHDDITEIESAWWRDFDAMTAKTNSTDEKKTIKWPRTGLAKTQANELLDLYKKGKNLDFKTQDPQQKQLIMDHFKKVANKYSEIYKSQGYELELKKFSYEDSKALGGYQIILRGSKNPTNAKLLRNLEEKLKVDKLIIDVDQNFFSSSGQTGFFLTGAMKSVGLSARQSHDPALLFKSSTPFHEIHHAYYEKSKSERHNLPYYGSAHFSSANHNFITTEGYEKNFSVEEIAAYRKELSILQSSKIETTKMREDFHLIQVPKNREEANLSLRYREAARSTLRILNNIEDSMVHNKNFLEQLQYNVTDKASKELSKVNVPLYDAEKKKVGFFRVYLVELTKDQESQKVDKLKTYLQQMKEEATKDYLDSQAKIEYLKSVATQEAKP